MTYRPPGFKSNVIAHNVMAKHGIVFPEDADLKICIDCVEKSADELLRVQREGGIKVLVNSHGGLNVTPESLPYVLSLMTQGRLVFIPDDTMPENEIGLLYRDADKRLKTMRLTNIGDDKPEEEK
jgi:hypothetical protein